MSSTRPVTLEVVPDVAQFVVDFLNTIDIESATDELDSLASWKKWLEKCGLSDAFTAPRSADLRTLTKTRGDLRQYAMTGTASTAAPINVQVEYADGAFRVAANNVTGLLGAAVATLQIEGRLSRIKICPADDCRWAFFDASKNMSRQWCSMAVCGNRAKARSHRERTKS